MNNALDTLRGGMIYLWPRNFTLDNFKVIKYTGRQLYCGEFGVIDTAPADSAVRWVKDVVELLDAYGIGHAYWNYKEMDFGLVDRHGNVANEELVGALFGK
ncbi:hypothetical protein [Paenibacillus sinensis]|uniref:hypothetical protein n=1 Tax=Paenibacillus sinensis TaxID=2834413 RepID=UPI001CAA1E34|nr:hypothetical protein [Paenibacillus sinensis]